MSETKLNEFFKAIVERIKFYKGLGVDDIRGASELERFLTHGAKRMSNRLKQQRESLPDKRPTKEGVNAHEEILLKRARELWSETPFNKEEWTRPESASMLFHQDIAVQSSGPKSGEQARTYELFSEVEAADIFSALPKNDSLEATRDFLGDCKRCRLCFGRKTIVFGVGNPKAKLMLIGEGPGAEEDEQGLPFVGRAGQLLTKILASIDLDRDEVYITNVVKCRPPNNRKPENDEIESCEPFLLRQINIIRPKLICALGGVATQALLKTKEPISKLRGKFIDLHGIPLIATFHPAYLLRNPDDKRSVWEDMQKVRDYLQRH